MGAFAGLAELLRRLRSLGCRQELEKGLDDEIRFHVEQQTDFGSGGGLKTVVGIRRVWHDFVLETSVENDQLANDNSFSVALLPAALWEPPTSAQKIGRLDFEAQRWYR